MPRKKNRGHLVLIGGAEDKVYSKTILQDFFQLAGGENADIIVLPTASNSSDVGEVYAKIFSEWGASSRVLRIDTRADADSTDNVHQLRTATGIFLTGGDQLKITSTLGGSEVAKAIFKSCFDKGVVIGGTSAGAAAMSSHMIISGTKGSIPRRGMLEMAPGLGLLNWMIVDQHFAQRERIGRLLSAVARNPALLGVGIDEDTAVIVSEQMLEVIGSGTVTIVDGAKVEYTNVHQLTNPKPVVLVNVILHVLSNGFHYDMQNRRVLLPNSASAVQEQPVPETLKRLT